MIDRLRQTGRDARNSSAAIILVLASVVSACAAVAGLTSWVTIAAAVAAVLSGAQVLRNELIVPMRIRSAESATVRCIGRDGQQMWTVGTAFQIAANHWITARHVIPEGGEVLLMIKGGESPAQVLYQDPAIDVAVLSVNGEWAWRASTSRSLPEPGDRVKVVGWTEVGDDQWLRITFDYLVQGQGEANKIALTGTSPPQRGFSGGPVIDMRTGRVVGILYSRRLQEDSGSVTIAFATPITAIPAQHR